MRRFFEWGGGILMLPLAIPVILLLIVIAVVIVAVMSLWAGVRWLYHQLPRHRRALRLARQALAEKIPGRTVVDWRIARRERDKVFVQATLNGSILPPFNWMCAVWDAEERIDELGTWRFQHGVRPRHAVRAYQASHAAGEAWPTNEVELIEQVPQKELPALARPGLHPYVGTLVMRATDGIRFYNSNEHMTPEYVQVIQASVLEVFDAECRRLHFRTGEPLASPPILPEVQAPIPPTPPDKVFIERLRHHLLAAVEDEEGRQRVRAMSPPELVEYGLDRYGELDEALEEEEID